MSKDQLKEKLKSFRDRLTDSAWKVFQGLAYTIILASLAFIGRESIMIERLCRETIENTPRDIAAHQQEHITDSVQYVMIAKVDARVDSLGHVVNEIGGVVDQHQQGLQDVVARMFQYENSRRQ